MITFSIQTVIILIGDVVDANGSLPSSNNNSLQNVHICSLLEQHCVGFVLFYMTISNMCVLFDVEVFVEVLDFKC